MKKVLRYTIAALILLFAVFVLSPTKKGGSVSQANPGTAQQRDVYSLNGALDIYNGSGTEQDLPLAFEAMLTCAQTDSGALDYLGVMYALGIGTEQNTALARNCWEKALAAGSDTASACLDGTWIYDGELLSRLLPEGAVTYYRQGMEYYYGVTVKQDLDLAFTLFWNANVLGNPYGTYGLGLCYLHGNGCEKDIGKAIAYFDTASKNGCVEACERLLTLYAENDSLLDEAELRTVISRYNVLLHRTAGSGNLDDTLAAVTAELMKPGKSAEVRAEELYNRLFDGKLEAPETAEDYFNAAVYYLAAGAYYPAAYDVAKGNAYLEEAAAAGNPYAKQILTQLQQFAEREAVRLKNEEKLAQKQAKMPEGQTATLKSNEKAKFTTPARVKSIVKTYLYDVYNIRSDYWLLYKNESGMLKVRIVDIPAVQKGQRSAMYDRLTGARICYLGTLSSGYLEDLLTLVTEMTHGFEGCELLQLFALDETNRLYECLPVPDAFTLFQMQSIYSGYFTGDYQPDNLYISQELLGIMYVDLIPEEFMPY